MHFSPGHGELLELPIYSHDGFATALLFENVPGGALEPLAHVRYDDDPAAYRPPRARRPADPLPDGRRARRPRRVRPVVGPRSPAGRADADRARGLRAPEQRALRAGHGRRAHRRGPDDGAGRELGVLLGVDDRRGDRRRPRLRRALLRARRAPARGLRARRLGLDQPDAQPAAPRARVHRRDVPGQGAVRRVHLELQRPRAPGRRPRHPRAHGRVPGARGAARESAAV